MTKLLSKITPKILDYRDNFIKMELVNGLLMSYNYEHGEIKKLLNWSKNNLWIQQQDENINMQALCYDFYKTKTQKRIKLYLTSTNDIEIINNKNVGTIHDLLAKVDFNNLCSTVPTLFHGDFILENILKCDDEYKLIDWRQDFAGETKVGDKYYDLAKLRHNIFLNHENILNKLYNLKYINKESVFVDLKCNYTHIIQLDDFDHFVNENNLDLKKIKILTALIWLNMAPLHQYPLNHFLYYFGKYNLYLQTL